jgi:hypothetical protein
MITLKKNQYDQGLMLDQTAVQMTDNKLFSHPPSNVIAIHSKRNSFTAV